jgi:tetratricopeptide (TPR) repeat protein
VKIDSLIQEDASLDVHPEWKSLLDANYQYRVQAKEAEAMKASNASSGVMQKTRAAEFWQQAGEPKEAKRCAAVAESLIKRVNSQSDYPPEAGMYGKLADIYRSLSLPDDEIRNLLGAMKFAHNDDHVVRDYHRISEICEANSLPKPKLDGSVSLRLDPLNRFRVLAAKNERLAKTQSSSLVAHHLRSAIANWLKADERENAIRVCNDWAKQAMKDKTDSQFEQNCMKLAEFFSQLDRKAAAIKCYEEALLVTKYDFRKKEIQKQLDLLNADQN